MPIRPSAKGPVFGGRVVWMPKRFGAGNTWEMRTNEI